MLTKDIPTTLLKSRQTLLKDSSKKIVDHCKVDRDLCWETADLRFPVALTRQ